MASTILSSTTKSFQQIPELLGADKVDEIFRERDKELPEGLRYGRGGEAPTILPVPQREVHCATSCRGGQLESLGAPCTVLPKRNTVADLAYEPDNGMEIRQQRAEGSL